MFEIECTLIFSYFLPKRNIACFFPLCTLVISFFSVEGNDVAFNFTSTKQLCLVGSMIVIMIKLQIYDGTTDSISHLRIYVDRNFRKTNGDDGPKLRNLVSQEFLRLAQSKKIYPVKFNFFSQFFECLNGRSEELYSKD